MSSIEEIHGALQATLEELHITAVNLRAAEDSAYQALQDYRATLRGSQATESAEAIALMTHADSALPGVIGQVLLSYSLLERYDQSIAGPTTSSPSLQYLFDEEIRESQQIRILEPN